MTECVTIAGVDEAGRGPLAGPVVAAAVILPDGHALTGLDDSKKLTEKRRDELNVLIRQHCAFGIGIAHVEEIDRINILQATMLAMTRAADALCVMTGNRPAKILVDGNRLPQWDYDAEYAIGGDALHPCISAASIIAKVERDAIMRRAALDFPCYGWGTNKGYGTAAHIEALRIHGPTPLHRKSFAPVSQIMLL